VHSLVGTVYQEYPLLFSGEFRLAVNSCYAVCFHMCGMSWTVRPTMINGLSSSLNPPAEIFSPMAEYHNFDFLTYVTCE
jgi:hypothetical protein